MNLAIVPAAGRSSRLGRPKALLPFRGSTLIDRIASTLVAGGIDQLVVVAAPGESRLAEHCAHSDLTVAVNRSVADGMLSSIQCGLLTLSHQLAAAATLTICPVDFPALRISTVAALLAGLHESAAPIALPRHQGRRGHPIVLSASLAGRIETLDPRLGLRQLLDLHPHREVDVDDPGVHRDLDTWRDYLELELLGPETQPS